MFGPLRWVLIYVSDLKTMGEFYTQFFDLKPKMSTDKFIAFDTGAVTLELMGGHANGPEKMDDSKGWDRNKILISFIVDDIQTVVTTLAERGLPSVTGIRPTVAPSGEDPVGWIAQFMDPEGNLIEICQEPPDYV
jgi:predicted enzyme related to lactoylglutathione lyase